MRPIPQLARAARPHAVGQRGRGLRADRSVRGQQVGGHAGQGGLQLGRVDDDATAQGRARAGHRGQGRAEEPGRQRLGRRDGLAAGQQGAVQAGGSIGVRLVRHRAHLYPRSCTFPGPAASIECGPDIPPAPSSSPGGAGCTSRPLPRSRASAFSADCPSAATDDGSPVPPGQQQAARLPGPAPGRRRPPGGRRGAVARRRGRRGPRATCARRCGGCSRWAARWWPPSSPGSAWPTASRSTWPGWRRGPPACWRTPRAAGDLGVDPGPIAELELLPGWYDDWVLAVRARLQLRLLHALEELSRLLRRAGRTAAAVEAMHVAVLAEPLRESGQLRADRGTPGGRRLDRRPAAVRRVPQHPAPGGRGGTEPRAHRRRRARRTAR